LLVFLQATRLTDRSIQNNNLITFFIINSCMIQTYLVDT